MSKTDLPTVLPSILRAKCPNCRRQKIYLHKSVFPLKDALKTLDYCTNCKIKIRSENAPGINYALSVVVYFLGFILYASIWGIT